MFNKAKCSATMKVLIACEESQAVCKTFRARASPARWLISGELMLPACNTNLIVLQNH